MIALMLLVGLTVYLAIAVMTARWIGKNFKKLIAKWGAVLGVLLMFFLIPTGDVIVGNYYFTDLCEREGGGKIHKTVKLGDEFFLKSGEIDFNTAGRLPAKGGELSIKKIKTDYSITSDSQLVSSLFHIEKHITTISDLRSGQTLAIDTQFFRFGGWLENSIRMNVHGDSCPAKTMSLDLVFKRINSSKLIEDNRKGNKGSVLALTHFSFLPAKLDEARDLTMLG